MASDWKPREHPAFPLIGTIGIAVLFHLLMFTSIRVAKPSSFRSVTRRTPPETSYLVSPIGQNGDEYDPRKIWSPVIYFLPTEVGFSKELDEEKLKKRPTPPVHTQRESFFETTILPKDGEETWSLNHLLITKKLGYRLSIPANEQYVPEKKEVQQVFMVPNLEKRRTGDLQLSSVLSAPSESPWKVRAEVRVSKSGFVESAFIADQSESVEINKAARQAIYNMRFEPSLNEDSGIVEIVSPSLKVGEEKP